jgi:hypothetical protein
MLAFLEAVLTGDHRDAIERHRAQLQWAADIQKTKRCETYPTDLLRAVLLYSERVGTCPNKQSIISFVMTLAPTEADSTLSRYEQVKMQRVNPNENGVATDLANLEPCDKACDSIDVLALEAVREARLMFHAYCAESYITALMSSGPEDAKTAMMKRWTWDLILSEDKSGAWHENTEAIETSLFKGEKGSVIKTLIREMDEHWIIRRGRTLLIAGSSGDGKTTLLLTLIYNFALQGLNVLAITMELGQDDMWEMLAFIHTERFKQEFTLPSQFQWQQRKNNEANQDPNLPWNSEIDKANMRKVIKSVKARDKVPGLIDVQPFCKWDQIESYLLAKEEQNKYDVLSVDYFGERMDVPGKDARDRNVELNNICKRAINFAKHYGNDRGVLMISPVQVKKGLKERYNSEFVDEAGKHVGFEKPYHDIEAVRADIISALSFGCDLCIGTWTNEMLRSKYEGIICCMKTRGTTEFPTFRYLMQPNSKYVRGAKIVRESQQIEFEAREANNRLMDVEQL